VEGSVIVKPVAAVEVSSWKVLGPVSTLQDGFRPVPPQDRHGLRL
jgi:hypothetical protein